MAREEPVIISPRLSMRHDAIFRLHHPDAASVFGAVAPEMDEKNSRSQVECRLEGGETLVLKVSARDIAALRAALNMWLRLINIAKEMQDLIKRPGVEDT
jgi:KEOPS complex subunit Pcc1